MYHMNEFNVIRANCNKVAGQIWSLDEGGYLIINNYTFSLKQIAFIFNQIYKYSHSLKFTNEYLPEHSNHPFMKQYNLYQQ